MAAREWTIIHDLDCLNCRHIFIESFQEGGILPGHVSQSLFCAIFIFITRNGAELPNDFDINDHVIRVL